MKDFVLDASALLRFTENEAGAERVREIILAAHSGQMELFMSPVNWGEIVYTLLRLSAIPTLHTVESLPIAYPEITKSDAAQAARFRYQYKLPYADSFAAALAQELKATLLTADYDFKVVKQGVQIEFLPPKP